MDEYSSKRTVGGVAAHRKGSGLVLRDTTDNRVGNAQFCNRLGCSGRLTYSKGTRIGCLERPKSLRPSFRSSCGKEVTGSSSRTLSSGTNAKKCIQEFQKKLSSKLDADSSSSSGRDESVVQNASSRRFYMEVKPEARETKSNKVALMEVGKPDLVASNTRTRKVYRQKFGMANQDTQIGSSSVSSASETTGQRAWGATNTSSYCLKHISCKSISDVLTQGDSYSESNNGRRKDMVKKEFTEGGSSSRVRGKKMTGQSSEKGHISLSAGGISISDTRRAINGSVCRESGVSSVRTQRSVNGNTMRGCLNLVNGNNPSLNESPILAPHVPQPEIRWFSGETSSSGSSFGDSHSSTNTLSACGISISDTRQARNGSVCRESGVSSVRTRSSVNGNTMRGCLNLVNGNNPSLNESPIPAPHVPQPEICWFSGETSSSGSSFNGSHSSTDTLSAGGISISDTRRARNGSVCRESGVSSVRTQRSGNGNTMRGCLNLVNGNNPSLNESPIPAPHVPQPEIRWFSGGTSSSGSSFNGSHSSTDTLSSMMPLSSTDLSITHLMSYGGTRPYNMDGIADVLLALERIEQDEELTHEQLLSLEANLFLGGLNFYDQHRDMRLDIDNMSYEELVALEEEMGTVSTALSEEALAKCLRISMYQPFHSKEWGTGCSGDIDDMKCSICQEEFVSGDEIGRLGCEHGYHSVCINQWLRLKNWCPVCKGSAQASN